MTCGSVKGNAAEKALGRAYITCNKNGIPFDTEKPMITSGIRLGTPAGTTRGFGEAEFRQIADWIVEVVDGLAANGEEGRVPEAQDTEITPHKVDGDRQQGIGQVLADQVQAEDVLLDVRGQVKFRSRRQCRYAFFMCMCLK